MVCVRVCLFVMCVCVWGGGGREQRTVKTQTQTQTQALTSFEAPLKSNKATTFVPGAGPGMMSDKNTSKQNRNLHTGSTKSCVGHTEMDKGCEGVEWWEATPRTHAHTHTHTEQRKKNNRKKITPTKKGRKTDCGFGGRGELRAGKKRKREEGGGGVVERWFGLLFWWALPNKASQHVLFPPERQTDENLPCLSMLPLK